ncbi:hypothetical protein HK097_007338 [Rhizophlyctis rosea]|uniref:Uncharacterized protein n=1 Tax=Rhizophlyctis rosea TaxID=64517 RepID=A0AAD5SC12_9FUNG|nr:hypothetical protein HK097_007338 [Rhizophlyctis rosea]
MSLSSPVNSFLVDNNILQRGGNWAVNDWGKPIMDFKSDGGPMPRPNWGSDVGDKTIRFQGIEWDAGKTGIIFTNGQEGTAVTEYVAGGTISFYHAGDYGFAIYLVDDAYFKANDPAPATMPRPEQPNWECRRNLTDICTPVPPATSFSNDTWSFCQFDLHSKHPTFGTVCKLNERRFNRIQFNQLAWPGDWRGQRNQTMYLGALRISSWIGNPAIVNNLHLVVTALSLALSSLATLISLLYIIILHTRSIKLSTLGDRMTALSLRGKRNMMFHFMFAMSLLLVSDVLSVIVNMRSNGVTATDDVNRLGQGAMAAQLCAIAAHLVNRIIMYRAFQPITWYPKYLQYILIFISTTLPISVAVYIMYLVMQTPIQWNEPERLYILLSAWVWFFAVDNALTIASIVLLFRIRARLSRASSSANGVGVSSTQSNPNSSSLAKRAAHRRAQTVTFSLFMTLILALFICGYCIYQWKKYPYIGQLAIRVYFVGYVHYLVSLRSVVRVWREGERTTGNVGQGSVSTLGRGKRSGDGFERRDTYGKGSGNGYRESTNGGKGYAMGAESSLRGLAVSSGARSGSTLPPYDSAGGRDDDEYGYGHHKVSGGYSDSYGGSQNGAYRMDSVKLTPISRSDPGGRERDYAGSNVGSNVSYDDRGDYGHNRSRSQSQTQRPYGATRSNSQSHQRSPSAHRSPSVSRKDYQYQVDYDNYPVSPTAPSYNNNASYSNQPSYNNNNNTNYNQPPPTPTMQPGWATPPVEYSVSSLGQGRDRGRSRERREREEPVNARGEWGGETMRSYGYDAERGRGRF